MRAGIFFPLFPVLFCCFFSRCANGIDVVDNVELEKYIGRWYQVYTNSFTEENIFPGAVCVTADYAIDSTASNQVTVLNAARQDPTEGSFQTISGYAYIPDLTEPGKLKVNLGNVPVEGDYWIVVLGPDTYGDKGLYEYAVVSGPSGLNLFVLVRDPDEFALQFEAEVLEKLEELCFTEEPYAPIPTVQEGCLYVSSEEFDANSETQKSHEFVSKSKDIVYTAKGIVMEGKEPDQGHMSLLGAGKVMQAVSKLKSQVTPISDSSSVDIEESIPEWVNQQEQLQTKLDQHLSKIYTHGHKYIHEQTPEEDLLQSTNAVSVDAENQDPTVKELKVEKYLGRWYQAYSNRITEKNTGKNAYCVATDYGSDAAHPERITVFNMMRTNSAEGKFGSIKGYVYAPNADEPGRLKLQLSFIPFQGDYWILELGPETYGAEGLYEYAIVSGPKFDRLFILVRDVARFKELFEGEVLALVDSLGFCGEDKEPLPTPQSGCSYPEPQQLSMFLEDDFGSEKLIDIQQAEKEEGSGLSLRGSFSKLFNTISGSLFPEVTTVDELIMNQYLGRWYQVYASPSVYFTFERDATCVYAEYGEREGDSISVENYSEKNGMQDGITGYAYVPDASDPGKLKVHFDAAPTGADGDYWILGIGPVNDQGQYEWSIISDRFKALLFILARNIETFKEKYEEEVLAKVEELGFTYFWNKPVETDQSDCSYNNVTSMTNEQVQIPHQKMVQTFGFPLHASCHLQWEFEGEDCAFVQESLEAAAEEMAGLDDCEGEKCGYSIISSSDGFLELDHETPSKHYVDSITFKFTAVDGMCEVEGKSSSDTWYAVLDNGTNYCNMRNLVDSTSLLVKEQTSDAVCTQYSSADCETY
mmetsp:Transcript_30805/g.38599  ORF Transcript_30805/g.38599 Transcript_30805/m.38599 type:complete len:869 (+) Transcript_30805:85-2691(+)